MLPELLLLCRSNLLFKNINDEGRKLQKWTRKQTPQGKQASKRHYCSLPGQDEPAKSMLWNALRKGCLLSEESSKKGLAPLAIVIQLLPCMNGVTLHVLA